MSDMATEPQRDPVAEPGGPAASRRVSSASPAGETVPSKQEQVEAVLALAGLDAQLRQEEAHLQVLADLVADRRGALEDLRKCVEADGAALQRLSSSRRAAAETEALRQRLASNESSHSSLVAELAAREAEAATLSAALRRKRQGVDAQRAAVRKGLPPEVVALYDQALRSGREPLVTKLSAGICCGCYLRLATSIAQRVRRSRTLSACPHCGRLLQEMAEAEPTGPARPGRPRK